MIATLNRVRQIRLARYIAASAIALGADVGSFLAMLSFGVMPTAASAASYSLGILVHWLISSRKVFADSVAERGMERTKQKALFVISALAGLALTTAIVGVGGLMGIDPRIAKLFAIGASFTLTWMLRSKVIFRHAHS
ncbi:polysaccharide biosynthesis protein GtrA [Croceicoccus estronivorus]|uniref:GtrA family protein n=1 Tax=Croceicoccus estronivorus TaxID=1172626 RepID=UPI00082E5E9E|nr:GtrA family protein [Croceicoccus estronivorus]OCC23907.1 polysaccharide biosynthesis protein GtrA [Croceicoccus estronivorus]